MKHTRNKTFYTAFMGCPKNRVDGERLLTGMNDAGYALVHNPADAQVMIINSCAFLAEAIEETLDAIWDLREVNERAVLVVTGCLPLRAGRILTEELPEVDVFLEPALIPQLPRIIQAFTHGPSATRRFGGSSAAPKRAAAPEYHAGGVCSPELLRAPRTLTTSGHAFLKIAEGCARRCGYCAIPAIRGPLRSFDEAFLVEEARSLIDRGAKELVATAQDLTAYGHDGGNPGALPALLRKLADLPGLRWLRLMYLHPSGITDDLIRTVNECDTIIPYLDIPFQHVSDKVLRSMGRPTGGDDLRNLVDTLRARIPGLSLRTTFMVGYPTEGDREFRELLTFVKTQHLEHVGVFAYSAEDKTPALALGDPVPPAVKTERGETLRDVLNRQAHLRNKSRIGRVEQCLVEGPSEESDLLLHARAADQAPEVDGVVYICDGIAVQGDLNPVRITDAYQHDLYGEIVPDG